MKRRGRSVLAVVDGKFYFMALEGTALHYFDSALWGFHELTASAKI